jgi:hypothetical protein
MVIFQSNSQNLGHFKRSTNSESYSAGHANTGSYIEISRILRPTNRSRARTYGRFGEEEATGDGGVAPRGPYGGGSIHWATGDGDAAPPRSVVGHGLPPT